MQDLNALVRCCQVGLAESRAAYLNIPDEGLEGPGELHKGSESQKFPHVVGRRVTPYRKARGQEVPMPMCEICEECLMVSERGQGLPGKQAVVPVGRVPLRRVVIGPEQMDVFPWEASLIGQQSVGHAYMLVKRLCSKCLVKTHNNIK